jgi:tripartite-type tricarboxylate transporter receptor subunit TctC
LALFAERAFALACPSTAITAAKPEDTMRALFLALAVAAAVLPARTAAQDYPSKPVLFVVPYAAGGGTETMARLLGRRLEQRLGKPFVIENRPGAGTSIAAAFVAKSAPDGHTILLATSTTMAINVSIYRHLSYNPVKDLMPVALFSDVPFVLVVNPSLPARSVEELVKLAKGTPGGLAYASNGHGGAGHLYAELLKSMAGIEMTHVPYKGLAPAFNDVVAGHVPLMFGDFGTALPLIRSGQLRALGVTTAQRVAAAPDIPPLSESGLPGYVASSWQMVVAPAGIPASILNKLNGELRAILSEPDTQKDFAERGLVPVVSPPPDELQRYVKSEIVRWGKVVEQAGAAGSQ